jgi:hypothetical protein
MQTKLLTIISVDFDMTDQLLIVYCTFVRYCKKNGSTMGQYTSYFVNFKKAYDSVSKKVLYNILMKFGFHKKLFRLSKMSLNETYRSISFR